MRKLWESFLCLVGLHDSVLNEEFMDNMLKDVGHSVTMQIVLLRGRPVRCRRCGKTGWDQ